MLKDMNKREISALEAMNQNLTADIQAHSTLTQSSTAESKLLHAQIAQLEDEKKAFQTEAEEQTARLLKAQVEISTYKDEIASLSAEMTALARDYSKLKREKEALESKVMAQAAQNSTSIHEEANY